MILNTCMYLSKGPSVLDNSENISLILSLSIYSQFSQTLLFRPALISAKTVCFFTSTLSSATGNTPPMYARAHDWEALRLHNTFQL